MTNFNKTKIYQLTVNGNIQKRAQPESRVSEMILDEEEETEVEVSE